MEVLADFQIRQVPKMGRAAKFYKKSKPQKTEKHLRSEEDNPQLRSGAASDVRAASRKRIAELRAAIAQETNTRRDSTAGKRDDSRISSHGEQEDLTNVSNSRKRLKSKLWKDLEAHRAEMKQPEIATPKEAGIDYLSQWEKRKRR